MNGRVLSYHSYVGKGRSTAGSLYPVSCPCGASLVVDLKDPNALLSCPECKGTLQAVVSIDPRTSRRKVGIVVAPVAVTPSRPAPAKTCVTICRCGARLAVELKAAGRSYACAACGALHKSVQQTDRVTGLRRLILVAAPAGGGPKGKPRTSVRTQMLKPSPAPAGAPPPPPKTEPGAAPRKPPSRGVKPPVEVKESLLMMAQGTIGAQPIARTEESSTVACFCGSRLALSDEAARRIVKCPECGKAYRIFLAVDPATKKPMAVMVPRSG